MFNRLTASFTGAQLENHLGTLVRQYASNRSCPLSAEVSFLDTEIMIPR